MAPLALYPPRSDSETETERNDIVILDGGLGTTLEQTFHLDISHILWSAHAAIAHPHVIVDAHLAFLRAGARVILTSTYQCMLSTFEQAGYAPADARDVMRTCVRLAVEARARFCAEQQGTGTTRLDMPDDHNASVPAHVKIALSLGPFGAGLSPAQEFDGFYPPPYGPSAYSEASLNRNAFAAGEEAQEAEATEALARFHFDRLCAFADDAPTWDALDFVAFETVPLVREVTAIRMAVARLEKRLRSGNVKCKPWWISFVFPGGRFPQQTAVAGEEGDVTTGTIGDNRVAVRAVVEAALSAGSPAAPLPCPSALGINCTATEFVPRVLAEMEAAVRAHNDSVRPPWLVVYPNGGDVYDPVSQTWVVKDKGKGGVWAEELHEIVARATRSGVWAGVTAGGCCRTGPEDIALLSKLLRSGRGNVLCFIPLSQTLQINK
ncbi:Homocysteine S-methyltransferase [Mycena sp. CBHHK59/15]|nr:Homocysteine S-methyltransferase [Mycena sp. CBHHK59/15]KAJ6591358.1 Homocysteine S-methyltransferase [Mycena sp. CBHHK59/15]